jgi:hypothetical protein
MSLDFDVFVVGPKPIPSAVPGFEEAVGPATWPPSTSTLISDDDGGLPGPGEPLHAVGRGLRPPRHKS